MRGTMDVDLSDLESQIIDLAWNNYYKTDVLRGYCENNMGEKISSVMMVTLLDELCTEQRNLINFIDKYTTDFNYEMYNITKKQAG